MRPSTLEREIVLLSGAVAAGKSSVARALIEEFDFQKISTSNHLTRLAAAQGLSNVRLILQNLGDNLDEATDYSWPVAVAREQMAASAGASLWLLDAVRKERQVVHFRRAFASVLHVHLTAAEIVLRTRYSARANAFGDRDSLSTYEHLIAHPNEVASRSLQSLADLVFDTSEVSPPDIAQSIVTAIKGRRHGADSPH